MGGADGRLEFSAVDAVLAGEFSMSDGLGKGMLETGSGAAD